MSRFRTSTTTRRRALIWVAMLVLVWCQSVAMVHATTMTLDAHTTGVEMAAMTGCDGLPDAGGDTSDCPSEDATADVGKLPLLTALPLPTAFSLIRAQGAETASLVRRQIPQGRAPPRTRLCSWLI